MDGVNLREKFAHINDNWSPKVVGERNGQHVKPIKRLGEFVGRSTAARTSCSSS